MLLWWPTRFMVAFSKIVTWMGTLISGMHLVHCMMQFRVFVPGVKSLICRGFRSSTLAFNILLQPKKNLKLVLLSPPPTFIIRPSQSLFFAPVALQSSGLQTQRYAYIFYCRQVKPVYFLAHEKQKFA